MSIQYVHTNIIAKDWKTLADFYINVFQCKPLYPERNLSGSWVDQLTQIKSCKIRGIHLRLPGYRNGPTLEIFSYEPQNELQNNKELNKLGLAHLAFHVDSVENTLEKLLIHGGIQHGEVVKNKYDGIGTLTAVYACDPEGNYIEIQNWNKEKIGG